MKTTAESRAILPGKRYVRDVGGGIKLEAEVSPCVFMYPNYPLQVQVTLMQGAGTSSGSAIAVDRGLTAQTAAEADVYRLLSSVGTVPCSRCEQPAFDPATVETNRAGLCEECFLADLEAELELIEAAEKLRLASRDRRMKSQGMAVRVSAWVHPEEGDDYQVDWYFAARPPRTRIRALLRNEGSCVLDDFQVFPL